jgi:uncharacterized RDD family membrane protein YckC
MIDPDTVETRFVPPPAEAADTLGRLGVGELASRSSRLGAAVIDGLLAATLAFSIGLLSGVNLWTEDEISWRGFLVYLLAFLVFALIQGWPLVQRGQTLGKMVMQIRIVRADGSRAGIGRMLGVRLALFWALGLLVPMFGMLLVLLDLVLILRASRRCLHDLVADTVVVKA